MATSMRRTPGVTVLALFDRISVFHTLMPFLLGLHKKTMEEADLSVPRFTYTDRPKWCLRRDRNRYLIITRMFLKPPVVDLDLLARLRKRYDRIYFLNGNAGGAIHRPEVLPFVDRFYNKAVFRDRSIYGRALYGTELFTDFAHREYGVQDDEPWNAGPVAPDQVDKIHCHWNIGVGDFPRSHLRQRIGVALSRLVSPKAAAALVHRRSSLCPNPPPPSRSERNFLFDINARLGSPGYPTVAHHRQLLGRVLNDAVQKHGWSVARDRVPVKRYFSEMERSRITFSPFGWGEVCFRDFEAIRAGSLLLKPDMGHLETWPDVFVPDETYVPVAWDGSDLADVIERCVADHQMRARITAAADQRYRAQLADLPERAAGLLTDLTAV